MRDGREHVHYTIVINWNETSISFYVHGTILYFSRIYQNLLRLVKQDPASLVHKVALGSIENKGLSELVENFLGLIVTLMHSYLVHIKVPFTYVSVDSVFSATSILQIDKAYQLWDARTKLNELQREAIERGVKQRFQLIQGPPGMDWRIHRLQGHKHAQSAIFFWLSIGTGKSVTGAHLAYILAKLNGRPRRGSVKGCVVYCGPSNKAVDVVHGQLSKTIVWSIYEYLSE